MSVATASTRDQLAHAAMPVHPADTTRTPEAPTLISEAEPTMCNEPCAQPLLGQPKTNSVSPVTATAPASGAGTEPLG
jgi:hypothetical protein